MNEYGFHAYMNGGWCFFFKLQMMDGLVDNTDV
jgi:hypothetical protein